MSWFMHTAFGTVRVRKGETAQDVNLLYEPSSAHFQH